jgi:hypothetical protein
VINRCGTHDLNCEGLSSKQALESWHPSSSSHALMDGMVGAGVEGATGGMYCSMSLIQILLVGSIDR